eukprot:gene36837-49681_t
MSKEDLMRIAIEVDCGYVAIELLLTFPKLKQLNCDASLVQQAVKNSVYLLLSDDGKCIRRVSSYRAPEQVIGISNSNIIGTKIPSTFMEAVQSNRCISTKKFLNSHISRDLAEIEVMRRIGSREFLRSSSFYWNLKSFFLSPSIHNSLITQA